MPVVSLVKQKDYTLTSLRNALTELLAPLGGMSRFVKAGDRVLLKLNFVGVSRQNNIAYTQAEIFQCVAEMALACGGRVVCGDSPGFGSAARVAGYSSIAPVAKKLGVPVIEFTAAEQVAVRGFRKLALARELAENDVVINLPRLKTHGQMLLTAAVKNMFGAVVGTQKFTCHYRAGTDYLAFASMIYDIYRAATPHLTILDAIVAMDGDGPTAGRPRPLGFLAAGTDATAIDATMMRILGRQPEELYTIAAATLAGDNAWRDTTLSGITALAELRPDAWQWPESHHLAILPSWLWRFIPFMNEEKFRGLTAAWPRPLPARCNNCGQCARICPAHVITPGGAGDRPQIDRRRCIRCYCCQELCPRHAIELKGGMLARMLRYFT